MSNLKHDPDFPYVVMWGEYAACKYPASETGKANAESQAKRTGGRVVDTTPPPPLESGYYLIGKSGVYYLQANGGWLSVEAGFQPSPYPNTVPRERLVRLVPEVAS